MISVCISPNTSSQFTGYHGNISLPSNRLVFLSVDDLSLLHEYTWPATDNHCEVCRNPNDSPAGSVSTLEVLSHDCHMTPCDSHMVESVYTCTYMYMYVQCIICLILQSKVY